MVALRCSSKLPPLAVLRQTEWTLDFTVEGRSMEPLLTTGDRVTVVCAPPDALAVGDLVCFQADVGFVLHRLLARRDTDGAWYYEKGDAESGGSWIESSRMLGRVLAINGSALDLSAQKHLLEGSRAEERIVRLLRRLGLPRLPAFAASYWHHVKKRWRGRWA